MPKDTVMIAPHTHWDREWYLTFQEFRFKLVSLVKQLLDLLEDEKEYSVFNLDGQYATIDDYLEIHPEDRQRIAEHIKAGRIAIGPWYVLPDEFLVSGESLVRNLLKGYQMGGQYGGWMKLGYLPDTFGHVAQMPQILKGFEIDTAMLWRGVGSECDKMQFLWRALDGSSVFTAYLADSYSNGVGLPTHPQQLAGRIQINKGRLAPFVDHGLYLLMNGSDHQMPQWGLAEAVRQYGEMGIDAVEFAALSSYVDELRRRTGAEGQPILDGELRSPERAPLLTGTTSIRIAQKQRHYRLEHELERFADPLGAMSSALAKTRTREAASDTKGFRDRAWQYMLLNEPHDSICGCSIDAVHEEMDSRYSAVEQILKRAVEKDTQGLANAIDTSCFDGARAYMAYNPVAQTVTGALEGEVLLSMYPMDTDKEPGQWHLVDDQGHKHPLQILEHGGKEVFRMELPPAQVLAMLGFTRSRELMGFFTNEIRLRREAATLYIDTLNEATMVGEFDVDAKIQEIAAALQSSEVCNVVLTGYSGHKAKAVWADAVPGFGWKTYQLAEGPAPLEHPIHVMSTALENQYCQVRVLESGEIQITDKSTGAVYTSRLVEGGDRGDLYTYTPPENDVLVSDPVKDENGRPLVACEVVEEGPIRGSLRVTASYDWPEALEVNDRSHRSHRTLRHTVTTLIRLAAGSRQVEFETSFENTSEDHRVRVHFAAPWHTGEAAAEVQFGVIRRPVVDDEVLAPREGWVEQPVGTAPHKSFVSVNNPAGGGALTLINQGLPEYEAYQEAGGTVLALTLLRSTGWLSRPDLHNRKSGHAGPGTPTPGGQSKGHHSFRYGVVLHRNRWLEDGAYVDAHSFNAPVRVRPIGVHSGILATQGSWLRFDQDEVVVSTMKEAENEQGIVVRFYSLSDEAIVANAKTATPFKSVSAVNLAEAKREDASLVVSSTQEFSVHLNPYEIKTLYFEY